MRNPWSCAISICSNGLFPLLDPDSDSDSDTYSCTMQAFSIGSNWDSDPLIEMYVIGMKICPWDRDPSLKWAQYPFGKGIQILVQVSANMFCIILCRHRVWNPSPNPDLNPESGSWNKPKGGYKFKVVHTNLSLGNNFQLQIATPEFVYIFFATLSTTHLLGKHLQCYLWTRYPHLQLIMVVWVIQRRMSL